MVSHHSESPSKLNQYQNEIEYIYDSVSQDLDPRIFSEKNIVAPGCSRSTIFGRDDADPLNFNAFFHSHPTLVGWLPSEIIFVLTIGYLF